MSNPLASFLAALGLSLALGILPAQAQKTPAARQATTPAAPATPPPAASPAPPSAAPAAPAAAQDMIDATDPERIAAILKGFGIARVEANSNSGNPQIDGRADGKPYKLFFYGCKDNRNCKSVQFWAYWDDETPLEALNSWNKDTRYGKVYLDDDEDVVLEYDVNLVNGVSERTFEDNADIWTSLLSSVEKKILGK